MVQMNKSIFANFLEEENPAPKKAPKKGISKETKAKVKKVAEKEKANNPGKEENIVQVYDSDILDDDIDNDFPPLSEDLTELALRSNEAQLKKHINDEKLQQFKIEQSKIDLLKKAGDLAEVEFMKFVYLGYMEKVSIDLLRMTKKLETRMKAFVEEGDYKGLAKLIDKEHSLILATVKKNQKEDLKKWEKENRKGRK